MDSVVGDRAKGRGPGVPGLLLLVACCTAPGCPLPEETSSEWACSTDSACAEGWRCVDGTCRRTCRDGSDCAGAAACVSGACVPGTVVVTASSSTSAGPGSGSRPGRSSSARTASGGGAPIPSLFTFTAGGGHGETGTLRVDWCLGEAVASSPPPGGVAAWGVLGTVEPYRR